jgi:hypothetical protein
VNVLVPIIAGVLGVTLGAFLPRRNEKRARAERLLVEALNDAVGGISDVAGATEAADLARDGGLRREAERNRAAAVRRYSSAVSRIALNGPPPVVDACRRSQDDPTTMTYDGRTRLIAAVQAARAELGHGLVDDDAVGVLLFGTAPARGEGRASD